MSVDIYAAFMVGKTIEHADGWDESSTLNMANATFWTMVNDLGLQHEITSVPGHIRVKVLEDALSKIEIHRYKARLVVITAVARIKRAPFIAFA